MEYTMQDLEQIIRKNIPGGDSSKRDFLPIYADGEVFGAIVRYLAEPYRGKVDYVVSPESLGFILGSVLARELGVGFVALRKNKRVPKGAENLLIASYIDHRDHVKSLWVRDGMIPEQSRVLLADDYVETAATVQACTTLIEESGASIEGIASLGADYHSAARSMIDAGLIRCVLCEK